MSCGLHKGLVRPKSTKDYHVSHIKTVMISVVDVQVFLLVYRRCYHNTTLKIITLYSTFLYSTESAASVLHNEIIDAENGCRLETTLLAILLTRPFACSCQPRQKQAYHINCLKTQTELAKYNHVRRTLICMKVGLKLIDEELQWMSKATFMTLIKCAYIGHHAPKGRPVGQTRMYNIPVSVGKWASELYHFIIVESYVRYVFRM